MQQPHSEPTVEHRDTQQNTGNHKKSGASDAHRFGGTRAGKENIEKASPKPATQPR